MSGGWTSWYGAAAVLLPLLVAAGVGLFLRRRRRVAAALGDRTLVARLLGEDLFSVPWPRVLAVLAAAAALGAALADPRWGSATEGETTSGGRVVLVLDASGSMLAEDVVPNRLERQREAARTLVRSLPDASVAVVVFAGRAYALVPPTADRGALEVYLDALDPSIVTQTGSSLSAAIRQGLGLLAAGEADLSTGALVLITDGDARGENAQVAAAAELAGRAGVPIFALGAGTEGGAPVPDVDLTTGDTLGVKREPGGEIAVSRLNAPLLREIAERSGGEYASLAEPGAVEAVADALRDRRGEGDSPSDRRPARFAWFAAAALLLLTGEGVVAGRRRGEAA